MNTDIQENVIEGRLPNAMEKEMAAWADEAVGKGIPLANDGLRLIATLTTSLLAGSAFLVSHLQVADSVKWLSAFFLLVALAASLVGLLPISVVQDLTDLEAIGRVRQRGFRFKSWCLRLACGGLLVGLAVLVGGALAGK
jgi:hypothetical protein